ncbi:uncharacterized protein A4U43_C01F2440 [Asparagus officinalis]|uniref:DYW domain-containing protein n=2 Tax=Asparagus officinalis TaxID=4686 RepID=A0A5P1FL57_ASPOF|nr:uncharacterized protein A4U43_C01F2440 [Asparagus officinalis]
MNSGNLNAARKLFDEMPQLTTVSYNAIISGYNKCGQTQEPLTLLTQMHSSNTKLNETTFTSLLSACSRSSSFDLGKQIHSLILKSGFEGFSLVGSSLLNLYTSCFDISNAYRLFELLHCRNPLLWSLMVVGFVKSRMLDEALDLFDKMNVSSRDVYSWTSLISGCAQNDDDVQRRKALELFVSMTSNGDVKPNEFTYDSVLRACVKLEAVDFGRMIHGCLIRLGLEHDDSISGALVEFYCKLGYLDDTKRVFDQLDKNPCLNTCNLMIGSLVDVGNIREAEFIFNQLEEKNPVSYNLMIKGYADNGRIQESIALFDRMPCKNIVSYNTMISVYHKAGMFDKALKLFEFVKEENNTVTWNSMISGYVQNEQPTEAIKLYAVMQRSSIVCSRSTFSALFRACASMGTVSQGRMIHAQLIKTPFASNVFVGTSLVDMYAKCGSIDDSKLAFRGIISPNVASWTALINGLAHNGLGIEAILEFEAMLKHQIDPNTVTFTGILLACAKEGKVDEGIMYFNSMQKDYGLNPTVEHYACIVDVLGRSGRIQEAEQIVLKMPIEADSVVWGTLLNACWFCMDLEVGERVAERMLGMDSMHVSVYVILSNIYARVGRWEKVREVREKLRGLRVKKDPGCSWIEAKDRVHVFCVEDRSHPESSEIFSVLGVLRDDVCSSCEFGFDPFVYDMHEHLVDSF